MKRRLLITLLMLLSFTVLAQKKIGVKNKQIIRAINYVKLPRVINSEGYKKCHIVFSDFNNNDFVTTGVQPEIQLTSYVKGFLEANDGDYQIAVTSMNDTVVSRRVVVENIQKKNSEGKAYTKSYYSYLFEHNQEIQIEVLDKNKNNKVILDTMIVGVGSVIWPNNFTGANTYVSERGYSNEKALKHMFKRTYVGFDNETESDVKIRIQKKKEFHAIGERSVTLQCFTNDVRSVLNDYLAEEKVALTTYGFYAKTKDERFDLLDSVGIYTKEGSKLLNDQVSNKVLINWHTGEAYNVYNNLYKIYKKFYSEEFINLIKEDDAQEFRYAMRTGVYFTAILTSRYEEAKELYKLMHHEAEESVKALNRDEKSIKGAIQSAKSTIQEKYFYKMDNLIDVLLREQELYKFHASYYNYIK